MPEAAWKPWAAGVLAASAIAMIGRNLISPLIHRDPPFVSPSPPAAPSPPILVTGSNQAVTPSDSNLLPIDTSRLAGWIQADDRDPFGSRIQYARSIESEGTPPPVQQARSKNLRGIKISAVAWGHGKMALVDGVAVRVGDSLSDGILLDISPDRLAFRGPAGDTILRFREGMTP